MSEPTLSPSAPKRPDGARDRVRRRAGALLALVAPGTVPAASGGLWASLWPFPVVVFSAFLISWGAECAQFLVSQGMALAILAWLQALPEFAVEAVIAWSQQVHFMTANFTGSLRLLVGLGWPLIFSVAAISCWKRERRLLKRIVLDSEHCVEVLGLGLPILYFLIVYFKGTLALVDAAVLTVIYFLYLWVLRKVPPRELEEIEHLEAIPRRIMGLSRRGQITAIVTLFVSGGLLLYFAAEPFLHSMLGFAVYFGVSEYLFIQWVAPFLSEFPEKLSAIYWARRSEKASMALMNMVSANINQWTMLAAMIPIVYSFSIGSPTAVEFDDHQRREILLTVAQSMLGMLLLWNMSFHILEAGGIFVLWGVQFAQPHLHTEITMLYFAWVAYELIVTIMVRRRLAAYTDFVNLWRQHAARARIPAS